MSDSRSPAAKRGNQPQHHSKGDVLTSMGTGRRDAANNSEHSDPWRHQGKSVSPVKGVRGT